MDIVLILICITCLVSVIALIIRLFWVYLHNYVPRLPFRKQWPPIALSVAHLVILILFVVFVIFHLAINLRKAERNSEEIDNLVKEFKAASVTVKNKLSAIAIPTITLPQQVFIKSRTFVSEIKTMTKFNEVESLAEHNILTGYEQLLIDLGDDTKCNINPDVFSSMKTQMNKTCAFVKNIKTIMSSLSPKYQTLANQLDNTTTYLNDDIFREEQRITEYWTAMNSFYDEFVSSLNITKTVINEIMRQSDETSSYIEESLTIYLPAIFVIVFTVICILLNTDKIKPNKRWIPTVLCSGFFILLLTAIVLSAWQVYLFAKTTDDCPEKPSDVLNFTVKAFNSDNPDDTISANDALLSCSRTHETFFFASKNQIRISDSIFIKNYKKKFLEGAINTFKYNDEFGDENFLKRAEDAQDLYVYMNGLDRRCSGGILQQKIRSYRNAVGKTETYSKTVNKFKESLKTITTIVSPMIETNLQEVNDPIFEPINNISKVLSESDINCHKVVEAFSIGLNPCKLGNKSVKSWTQCIAIICCALSAILYFLAFRRTDTKQFRFDNRQIWARKTIFNPVETSEQRLSRLEKQVNSCETVNELYPRDDSQKDKFRDENYACIKETRVSLKSRPDDFIHASWVKIQSKKRSYIVTQSPLPNTMTDFWSMCDQENIKTIVMLGPMVDKNVQCCAPYFPNEVNQTGTFENFQVTCSEIKSHPVEGVSWKVLKLVNSLRTNFEQKIINHVQLPFWKKNEEPEDPNQLIDLYLWVNEINKGISPICVHSYLGRGRAGTYVFFDYAYSQIQKNPLCNMMGMLKELRKMRHMAVDNVKQFEFVERCMVKFIIQEGILDSSLADKYFEDYLANPIEQLKTAESISTIAV